MDTGISHEKHLICDRWNDCADVHTNATSFSEHSWIFTMNKEHLGMHSENLSKINVIKFNINVELLPLEKTLLVFS